MLAHYFGLSSIPAVLFFVCAAVPPFCGDFALDTEFQGADIPGGVIVGVSTMAACAEKCYARSGCGAFSLEADSGTCWLKLSEGYTQVARRGFHSAKMLAAPGQLLLSSFLWHSSRVSW